ncbi:MAG: hypothetical protein L3K00_00770 [Thermoplasmata archaeon]|nr:hypothetical protein [Thermoplasmata archaeon]
MTTSFAGANITSRPPPDPHATPVPASATAAWLALNVSGPANRSEFGFVWVTPLVGGPYGLLFGGRNGRTTFDDTWVFANSTWQQLYPSIHPGPTRYPMVAWDAQDQQVLLFGGSNSTAYLNATWVFHFGHGWRLLHPGLTPPARRSGGLTDDPADHYVVLWGGHNGTAPNGSPNQQAYYTMLNDTWTFVSGLWSHVVTSTAPPPSSEPSLVYDRAVDEVIEFGGYIQHGVGNYTAFNQTWAYAAGVWTNLGLVHAPFARDGAAAAYDPNRGLVIAGGQDEGVPGECLMNNTWVLSGTTVPALHWNQLLTRSTFPLLDSASAVYDTQSHALILFGGTGTNKHVCGSVKTMTWLDGTWEMSP